MEIAFIGAHLFLLFNDHYYKEVKNEIIKRIDNNKKLYLDSSWKMKKIKFQKNNQLKKNITI